MVQLFLIITLYSRISTKRSSILLIVITNIVGSGYEYCIS